MTDEEIRDFLQDSGCPEHVVRGGKAGLLSRWREFVREVENGYRFGLEDYRNDLDLRGLIATLHLDEEPSVQEADQRLKALLTDGERRIWESGPGDAFWDFGYPKNATGDLFADLKAEGLVS